VEDVNLITGEIRIWHGKGDKYRVTFIGKEARKYLRKYLQIHPTNIKAMWINDEWERLTISGLRYSTIKYCKKSGIKQIGLHDFRRCFALSCYRKNVDIFSISQLLGHSTVEVTKRYLNIQIDDLRIAHAKGNPLD
jgi:site-specific recombinase XerD